MAGVANFGASFFVASGFERRLRAALSELCLNFYRFELYELFPF
jgi:hypothetical protein